MTRDRDFVLPEYVTLDRDGENGHNVILLGAPRQGKTYLLKYLTYRACIGRDLYDDDKSNIEPQACIWRARTHDRYLEFFKLGIGILAIPSGRDHRPHRSPYVPIAWTASDLFSPQDQRRIPLPP